MDQANYGGVSISLPMTLELLNGEGEREEEGEGEESEVMEVEDEDQRSEGMEMNWNIRQYLPQAGSCQELFNVSSIPDIPFQITSISLHTL